MIRVDDVVITSDEVDREVQYHPASSLEAARREAARALVVRALLRRELGADAAQLASEHDEADRLESLVAEQVPIPNVAIADCRQFYDAHLDRFRGPELLAASHILFAAEPGDAEAADRAREAAVQTIAELKQLPDAFAAIARRRSACPSGQSGGDLGQLTPDEVAPEMADALAELAPGELRTQPLLTRFGAHVVRLDERAPGTVAPFESVRDRIRIYLRDRAWRRDVQRYLARLAARADVRGFDLAAGRFVGAG